MTLRPVDGVRLRVAQFAWFLLFGLVTRISIFGDANFFHDELFYFMVGQRMHDGLLPYVDMWDRKGPGLFLTYYLIAGISRSVVAYQIVAWLFAAATALVVAVFAGRFAGRKGATLAGTLYLAILPLFGGIGGQTPVFYNLWIALAGLAVIRALPSLDAGKVPASLYAGMASAGFAITFKQTAVCESAFLGCFVLWQLRRAKMPPQRIAGAALAMIAAGIAPMVLFGLFYALSGHFAEFWHAMVISNLTKTYNAANDALMRITGLTIMILPAFVAAVGGIVLLRKDESRLALFFTGWLVAAIAGVAIVPNFFEHYMLPLAVPVAIASARALEYRAIGPAYAAIVSFLLLSMSPAFKFADRQASRQSLDQLAEDIRARNPRPRMLIYEGPVYLYAMLDSYPPSPLFYPLHLYFPPENGTSYLSTAGEVRKMIAWKPEVVITFHDAKPNDENQETGPLVHAYVKHCRLWFTREVVEVYGPRKIDVYGDCAVPER